MASSRGTNETFIIPSAFYSLIIMDYKYMYGRLADGTAAFHPETLKDRIYGFLSTLVRHLAWFSKSCANKICLGV